MKLFKKLILSILFMNLMLLPEFSHADSKRVLKAKLNVAKQSLAQKERERAFLQELEQQAKDILEKDEDEDGYPDDDGRYDTSDDHYSFGKTEWEVFVDETIGVGFDWDYDNYSSHTGDGFLSDIEEDIWQYHGEIGMLKDKIKGLEAELARYN